MQVLAHTHIDAATSGRLPKIGIIDFVNCLPVCLPLRHDAVKLEGELVYGAPTHLNRLFSKGLLQVGSISSHYYLTAKKLELIPRLAISSRGPIGSVLFFTKKPLVEMSRVIVPSCSQTSTNLLKIVLKEECGIVPDMIPQDHPVIESNEVDGALVIGDYALKIDSDWSCRYRRLDLGEWWSLRYGLPMVFGVFVVDKQWCVDNQQVFAAICNSLKDAIDVGLTSMFFDVVREAQIRTGLEETRLRSYFLQELDFTFNETHVQGLEKYRKLCQLHKLISC